MKLNLRALAPGFVGNRWARATFLGVLVTEMSIILLAPPFRYLFFVIPNAGPFICLVLLAWPLAVVVTLWGRRTGVTAFLCAACAAVCLLPVVVMPGYAIAQHWEKERLHRNMRLVESLAEAIEHYRLAHGALPDDSLLSAEELEKLGFDCHDVPGVIYEVYKWEQERGVFHLEFAHHFDVWGFDSETRAWRIVD